MTLVWSVIGIFGLHKWRQVETGSVSYNQAIIFMVVIKLILIMNCIWGGSTLIMLYIIFWF